MARASDRRGSAEEILNALFECLLFAASQQIDRFREETTENSVREP
jgi:hypothetical protein